MKLNAAILIIVLEACHAHAAVLSFDFESYAEGALVGQDGWVGAVGSDFTGIQISSAIHSPMNGSTKAVTLAGVSTSNRVARPLAAPINSGIYRVCYDFTHSGQNSTGGMAMVMRTVFYVPGHADQVFQQFCLNGGAGSAEMAVFGDPDALGSAGYGSNATGIKALMPNSWYRLAYDLDFDSHLASNIIAYDITSGSAALIGTSSGPFYFRNDGTTWNGPFGELGLGFDAAHADESWSFDNFSMTQVPEPASMFLVLAGALALTGIKGVKRA